VVQAPCNEEIANHIGPEPCGGIRKGAVQAPAGMPLVVPDK